MGRRGLTVCLGVAGLALAGLLASRAAGAAGRAATLGVRAAGAPRIWWRSTAAPIRWAEPDPIVNGAVEWHAAAPGISWGELPLAGSGEAWRLRVVLARVDPRRVLLRLANGVAPDGAVATWTLGSVSRSALLALNAGQFAGGAVWGWVVHDGVEYRAPGRGPLAGTVVIDRQGQVGLLDQDAAERLRRDRLRDVGEAFQSYPMLLEGDGVVPRALREPGPGIDLGHRDARLALGLLPDGNLLVALTRFDALGPTLGAVPFGLTIPELAALMGALGCRRAVALDGGVSAQMLVREAGGAIHAWPGLRAVPLALIAEPRTP